VRVRGTVQGELDVHRVGEPVDAGDLAGRVGRDVGSEEPTVDVELVHDLVARGQLRHHNSFWGGLQSVKRGACRIRQTEAHLFIKAHFILSDTPIIIVLFE
jgi:hypothetical protein